MSEKKPRRKKCKYERSLAQLVRYTREFIAWLDAEMAKPSDERRGRRIAQATNSLNYAVDHVRYFTLGVDYRTDGRKRTKGKVGGDADTRAT